MRRLALPGLLALVSLGCSRPASPPAHESPTGGGRARATHQSAPAGALTDVIQIDAGYRHTCALRASGEVLCWGTVAGADRVESRPYRIAGIESAREILIGDWFSLAVERTGEIMAWGGLTGPSYRHRLVENWRGRPVGDDERGPPPMDVVLTEPLDPALSAEAAAAAYPDDVQLHTKTRGFPGPLPAQWRITARAVSTRMRTDAKVFVAEQMSCTHHLDGELSCIEPRFIGAFPSWNESQTRHEPDLIDMIGTSLPEVCMLRSSGAVDCVRYVGEDPDEWRDYEFQNVRVPLPGPAAAIASDECAAVLLRDGRVVTWCDRLEDGRISTVTKINPEIDDAIAIDMGGRSICVLRRDDDVTCWYEGSDALFYMPTPRTITTLDHPTQLAVGSRHACALLADGRVQCWGANEHGQLGNGERRGELNEDGDPDMLIPDTAPTWVVAPTTP